MYRWISKDDEYHENLNVQPGRAVNVGLHMFMKISTDNRYLENLIVWPGRGGNVHMYMWIYTDN